jgi:hypothetical protein
MRQYLMTCSLLNRGGLAIDVVKSEFVDEAQIMRSC